MRIVRQPRRERHKMIKRPSVEQRKMLGAFLARKRAGLKARDVGLPATARRTPGLRREEVAVLAGVSVSWYTWLEQGRDIQASADTLRRICQVLRLDRVESAHLFALSSRDTPSVASEDREPHDTLTSLVLAMHPMPTLVRNNRLDILAWNMAITDLFVDYGALEPRERNTLRLTFLHDPYRTMLLDWEQTARSMLAVFRAERARASDKEPFDRLVKDISAESGEFRAWWPDVDVRGLHEGRERLRHPVMGQVDLVYISLAPSARPDLTVTAYLHQAALMTL